MFVEVAHGGTARLLDFGLAKSPTDVADGLTSSYALAGTPPYMSPEQADAGPVDFRSDLFGLGCVLYEMVHGTRLFADAPGRPPVLAQVRRFAGLRPAATWPGGPRPVAELIARLLQPRPADRPASAAEVAAQLQAAVSEPAPVRRRSWRTVAVGLMAASVAAVVLWQVTVRIRTADGNKDVTLRPPPGATVTVDGNGNAEVTVPAAAKPERSAAADPGPDFLESSAYLPFGDGVSRKITDSITVTDQTPAELVRWAKSLDGEYVPVTIGQFAGESDRPRLHAVAYKLTGPPMRAVIVETPADAPPGPSVIQKVWVKDRLADPSSVELRIEGAKVEFAAVGNALFAGRADERRKERKYPLWVGPEGGADGLKTHAVWAFNADRREWATHTDWSARPSHWAVRDLAACNQYVRSVNSYLTAGRNAKLCVVSHARPDDRDWMFPEGVRPGNLKAELDRSKAEGFVPIAVTSYETKAGPVFAFAAVRNRPRSVPPCFALWADLTVPLPKAPTGRHPDLATVMPFTDGVSCEVVDFSVAVDRTPEELHRWANTIGSEFSLLNLGGNADTPPPRLHGIAVKFKSSGPKTFLQYERNQLPETARTPSVDYRDRPHCAIGFYTAKGEWWEVSGHTEDWSPWWGRGLGSDDQLAAVAGRWKADRCKLSFLSRETPRGFWRVHFLPTNQPADGRMDGRLSSDDLATFAVDAAKDGYVVSHVIQFPTLDGGHRFGACAVFAPRGVTGRFRQGLTRAELMAALAEFKSDGFCPLSITSAGSGDAERYAASWIQFVVPDK